MGAPATAVQQPTDGEKAGIRALYQAVLAEENLSLTAPGQQSIVLPESILHVLRQALEFMSQGKGVAVTPILRELTTQRAADLLGVSRPFLVELLNKREIPCHMVGTHHRIYLKDLLRYRDHRDRERKEILNKMAREAVENGEYDQIYAADDGE
jgi:excisionase family DNA binding protein